MEEAAGLNHAEAPLQMAALNERKNSGFLKGRKGGLIAEFGITAIGDQRLNRAIRLFEKAFADLVEKLFSEINQGIPPLRYSAAPGRGPRQDCSSVQAMQPKRRMLKVEPVGSFVAW
jgi:hypothetical protein